MITHCSANATGRVATDWSMESLPCQTHTGLRSMIDATGTQRWFCAARGHHANVERRFGKLSEATRIQLAIHRISAEFETSLRYTETDDGEEFNEDFDREGQPEFNGAFR